MGLPQRQSENFYKETKQNKQPFKIYKLHNKKKKSIDIFLISAAIIIITGFVIIGLISLIPSYEPVVEKVYEVIKKRY